MIVSFSLDEDWHYMKIKIRLKSLVQKENVLTIWRVKTPMSCCHFVGRSRWCSTWLRFSNVDQHRSIGDKASHLQADVLRCRVLWFYSRQLHIIILLLYH